MTTLAEGRPDLSILESEFEFGDKFYEPQFCGTINDRDGESNSMNIRFRESESQIRSEYGIVRDVLRQQAQDYYD